MMEFSIEKNGSDGGERNSTEERIGLDKPLDH